MIIVTKKSKTSQVASNWRAKIFICTKPPDPPFGVQSQIYSALFCCCKGTVFFFSPEKFVFVHFWGKSNEWMKMLFFFFPKPKKKNSSEIEWMNDMWTFPWKKKNTHKQPKMREKKKHNQLMLKKGDLIKIGMNDRSTFPRK